MAGQSPDTPDIPGAGAPRTFTIDEVVDWGFEAYHRADNGVWWLFHGCVGLRSDPRSGVRTLISDPNLVPRGPWLPTPWGEQELRSGRDEEPADRAEI